MKGAITEPWASINNPPNKIIIKIIGDSQSFFRTLRNVQSSFKNSILLASVKIDF